METKPLTAARAWITARGSVLFVAVLLSCMFSLISCEPTQPPPRPSTSAPVAARQSAPLQPVATFASGAMPTGIAVSRSGRVFICFPRWSDPVDSSVIEIVNGTPTPFPNADLNRNDPSDPAHHLLCVQSVVVDPDDRLWALDAAAPNFGPVIPGGPKLVCFDLGGSLVSQTISFPGDVALSHSYLNDVRFDLRHGARGFAFITDSASDGPNAIIVVDLATGKSWRTLSDDPSVKAQANYVPDIDGQPLQAWPAGQSPRPFTAGADGIAISPDGLTLYYCPLVGDHLYQVPTAALEDQSATDAQRSAAVVDLGARGFASDGLVMGASGKLYLTDYTNHAIHVRDPNGWYRVLLAGPLLEWPDSMALGPDGNLYLTINQLQNSARFHDGKDLRRPPYYAMRIPANDGPVMR